MRARFGSHKFHRAISSGVKSLDHSVVFCQSSCSISLGSRRIGIAYPSGSKTSTICRRQVVLVHSISPSGTRDTYPKVSSTILWK